MRSSSKADEGKSKDQQTALISSVNEICRVAKANQLRLQHLELAIANLTSICNAARGDKCSVGLSSQGSYSKVQAEVIDMKHPFSQSTSQDDMLGAQMQQLVRQAAALGIGKEAKTIPANLTGKIKANPKAATGPAQKNMQATNHQKRSTKSLVQATESTTEKKMSMRLARVNNTRPTQPKATPEKAIKNRRTTAAAEVSLKSTVMKTKTTISKVYSSTKNVETLKGKGSTKLRISISNQGVNPQIAAKSRSLTSSSLLPEPPTAAVSDIKPRRRWSTSREISFKK